MLADIAFVRGNQSQYGQVKPVDIPEVKLREEGEVPQTERGLRE